VPARREMRWGRWFTGGWRDGLRVGGSASLLALGLMFLTETKTAWAAGDEPLLLEVHVNGHPTGKIGEFILRTEAGSGGTGKDGEGKNDGQVLLLRRNEMRDLGFRPPLRKGPLGSRDDATANELIPLSAIEGLTWKIDVATQSLFVTVPEDRLLPTMIQQDEPQVEGGRSRVDSGTGATVNYDVESLFTQGQKTVRGTLDTRFFSPRGVVSSGLLGYLGNGSGGGSLKNSLIRLDSTYSFGDEATLRRYSLGDFITSGLSWTRPIRMEGAQLRSDFSMRPDLVTFPLPSAHGSVAVPSTINVLADGNLLISQQIDPGPFEIPQLPVASGAGTITMTVVDALGLPVRISQPFYASSALLRPGLRTFAAQAGLVRLNWGVVSNQYGGFAGTGIFRRGMTSRLTLEATAEVAAGVGMAGGGGLFQVGNLGVANFSFAGALVRRAQGRRLPPGFREPGGSSARERRRPSPRLTMRTSRRRTATPCQRGR